jgi:D-amino-acid dehydrogenase
MRANKRTVAVIGAGIVGMSSALYLQKAGLDIRVIDWRAPGTATSFGSAGAIVTSAIEPTSTPKALQNIPRYLLDPDSAVRLRWRYLPQLAPWLVRFILAGQPQRVRQSAAGLHALLRNAYGAHRELASRSNTTELLRPTGWLKLFRTERGFADTLLQRQLMEVHGIAYDVLGPEEIHQLEPGLARLFARGLFHGDSASISSPHRLIEGYARAFVQSGGEFIHERVLRIEPLETGRVRLRCELGLRDFDHVVVAAGAWSRMFATQLGDKLVLDTERGYHLSIDPGDAGGIQRPICFPEESFVIAPMLDGIRLTSGEELAGLEAPPDFSRIYKLLPKAREFLPGLSNRVNREWMGRRPSTPDSLPVIGQSPNAPRVIYAFGHHHLGMTLGPITGRLIAQIISGVPTEVDLFPYRIERFKPFRL